MKNESAINFIQKFAIYLDNLGKMIHQIFKLENYQNIALKQFIIL